MHNVFSTKKDCLMWLVFPSTHTATVSIKICTFIFHFFWLTLHLKTLFFFFFPMDSRSHHICWLWNVGRDIGSWRKCFNRAMICGLDLFFGAVSLSTMEGHLVSFKWHISSSSWQIGWPLHARFSLRESVKDIMSKKSFILHRFIAINHYSLYHH